MSSNSRLESENRTNNRSKNSTADDKTKQTPTDGAGFYERGQREVYKSQFNICLYRHGMITMDPGLPCLELLLIIIRSHF